MWQRSAVKQNEFNHFVDSFSYASVHVPHFNAYEFICISSFVSNHIKTVALVSIYHCSSLPIQRDRVNAHLNCARRENHRPLRIRALPVYVCIIELTNMSAKPEYRTSRNLDTYKKNDCQMILFREVEASHQKSVNCIILFMYFPNTVSN